MYNTKQKSTRNEKVVRRTINGIRKLGNSYPRSLFSCLPKVIDTFIYVHYLHSFEARPKIENLIKIYRESFFNVPFAGQRAVSHRKLHVEHEKSRGRKEYLKSERGKKKKKLSQRGFHVKFHLKLRPDDGGGREDTKIK